MKIKTIASYKAADFDNQVNAALEEGWRLARRGPEPSGDARVIYYAELVLPDPVPEPEHGDPVEALRVVRDFCVGMDLEKCLVGCPLSTWCEIYTDDGISPADWKIPGEEAAT